jgi:glycosyltransferase involved in cell wall biosynthesis
MTFVENHTPTLDRAIRRDLSSRSAANMSDQTRRPRLIYITTHPIALRRLLVGQLAYFQQHGYDVIGIAAPGPDLEVVGPREGVQTIGAPMEREISPLRDFVSLIKLIRLFRRLRPDAICAGTAKASLLGLLAARFTRVPARVYMLHGLRLETAYGVKRRVLAAVERLTSSCAHRVMCISPSLREVYVKMGLAPRDKLRVLGHGSSNGVNPARFLPTPEMRRQTAELRTAWEVTEETPLIGFLGRFVKDKGVTDIIDAFDLVLKECPRARLLMVGEFESGDPVPDSYVERIKTDKRIIWPGFADEPGAYYLAMDVLAFPTYREGFGNVAIEAGMASKPVVVYNATGAVDTVRDGITGTVVPLRDHVALAKALLAYVTDKDLRLRHGAANFEMAQRDFRPEIIWQGLEQQFRELLAASGRQFAEL